MIMIINNIYNIIQFLYTLGLIVITIMMCIYIYIHEHFLERINHIKIGQIPTSLGSLHHHSCTFVGLHLNSKNCGCGPSTKYLSTW